VDIQIKRVEKLPRRSQIDARGHTAAKQLLARRATILSMGRGPLKRAIQRLLQNPLAVAVLEGQYAEGDRILVDRAKDGIP